MADLASRDGEQARDHLVILQSFRRHDFRLYWIGLFLAILGGQIQYVATAWLVVEKTSQDAAPVYLGLVGLAASAPTIALSLFGGVVADRLDRRRLLLVTQSGTALVVVALAILVATEQVELWHVFVLSFLIGTVQAFDQPARAALLPQLVERSELLNAVALVTMIWQSTSIVGPSMAGLLIASSGLTACFVVTAVGALAMVGCLCALRARPSSTPETSTNVGESLVEGLGYIRSNTLARGLIGLVFFNGIFGMSYVTLVPVFARYELDVGAEGFGFLAGASGVGALLGTLFVASLGDYQHKGRLLLGTSAGFGCLLVGFALSRWFPLSLGLLTVSGACNSVYMTIANTALQAMVPDKLRGRVMGVFTLTYNLMPVGGVIAGGIARVASVSVAVALGGTAVVSLAAMLAARSPQVRRLAT